MNMFCNTSFADRVKAISVPTLVIGGAADPFVPPDYLRKELVERIPQARLVVLPCGHHVPMEMPAETAALVTTFLAASRGLARAAAAADSCAGCSRRD
jgi:pimeloyl-ACP methyl ester carboxylesterase